MVTTSNHINPFRELGSIGYWSLEGLREMGSILTLIGTKVKEAHHRHDSSIEFTLYTVVNREDPSIRKPSMTNALKLLKESGFEVSEKTVKGHTMCTLRVSWPHNFITDVAPPAMTTGDQPC